MLFTQAAAHASGDTKLVTDAGSGNTDFAFAHIGAGIYQLVLAASELNHPRLAITIIDQTSPQVWEDQAIIITTYGNASAEHAFDFGTATQTVALAGSALAASSIAADAIGAVTIAASALTSAKFATGAIVADIIAADAIGSSELATGAITADVIAASAIGNAEFADGAIAAGTLAGDAITAAKIAADAITSSELATSAVDEIVDAVWDELLSSHNTEDSIGNVFNDLTEESATTGSYCFSASALSQAPTGGEAASTIADAVWDEILSAHNTEDSVGNVFNDLTEEDGSTGSYRLTASALSQAPTGGEAASTIADAVWDETSTGHTDAGKAGAQMWTDVDAILVDTGTDGVMLAGSAISNAKFADGAIIAGTFAAGAVDATAIASNALTNAKFATGAITADTIGASAIGNAEFADDAITAGTIAASALTSSEIADGAVTAVTLGACAITVSQMADGAITSGVLAASALTASEFATGALDTIADAVLDEVVENSKTLRQFLRIMKAALAGKSSGGGTATITFRNDADDGNRVVATVDSDGNRSSVTLTVS